MSAPDFYFAVNALFRYVHDTYGNAALLTYWRSLGQDYYAARTQRWTSPQAIADDWQSYFAKEPGAQVDVWVENDVVHLNILTCPAIRHLRENGREIVPYFCDHCDHVCGAMAESAGYRFTRTGGMGACQQAFVPVNAASTERTGLEQDDSLSEP